VQKKYRVATRIILAIAVTLGLFITIRFGNSIRRPIKQIAETLKTISNGDSSATSDEKIRKQNDEIGTVAKAAAELTGKLNNIIGTANSNTMTVSYAAQELSNTSKQMNSSSEKMTSLSTSVTTSARQVNSSIASISSAAEQMTASANTVAASSHDLDTITRDITHVKDSAEEITEAISQISGSTGDQAALSGMLNQSLGGQSVKS
jgi:methyl-accepting chemotaxis protein